MELDGFKGWCSKNHAFALKEKFNIVSRTRTLYISLHAQSPGLHTIPQTRSPILLFLDYTPLNRSNRIPTLIQTTLPPSHSPTRTTNPRPFNCVSGQHRPLTSFCPTAQQIPISALAHCCGSPETASLSQHNPLSHTAAVLPRTPPRAAIPA